ncbi:hypothetical protein Ga0100231_018270 [Opitutaceae bacterium TAV4]|nr:hypothetical protein Ga0100231_018270 [Opitutaceae bacterium TAV4]RRK00074.1 hypothetical protein Ga0100230_018985 [Opitutaceae bacterium TAV3]
MDIPTPTQFRLSHLHNSEWLSFHTEVRNTIGNDPAPGPTPIGITPVLWTAYGIGYANAQAAFAYERASALTQHIANADRTRDQAYRDLHAAATAYLYHPDASKRLAAERILTLFKTEGDLAQDTFSGESSYINNIDIAFNGPLSAEVNQLALAPWHDNLMTANHDFLTLWRQRTGEAATQTPLRMTTERPKLDKLYHLVVSAAVAQTHAPDTHPDYADRPAIEFIHRLNAIVIKYKEIVTRRIDAANPQPPPDTEAGQPLTLAATSTLP